MTATHRCEAVELDLISTAEHAARFLVSPALPYCKSPGRNQITPIQAGIRRDTMFLCDSHAEFAWKGPETEAQLREYDAVLEWVVLR